MSLEGITVNCPGCEVELEIERLARSTQCPYCNKKFTVEEGKKAHELWVQRHQNYIKADVNKILGLETTTNDPTTRKAKFCSECGRKLALDAKFCDWCGTRLNY